MVTDNYKQTIDAEQIQLIWKHYIWELIDDNREEPEPSEIGRED